jgi:two-component system, cell cycle sensor histidine kinase and response regulator CckA
MQGHEGDQGSAMPPVDHDAPHADATQDEALAVDRLLADRTVLEHLPGRVLLVSRDLRIVYLNRTTPGRAASEFVGTSVLAHLAEEHRATYREAFELAWATGKPGVLELRTRNGTWWEARVVPVKRPGSPALMLVTSVDISARKAAESALLESETRLRHAVEATGMGTFSWDSRTDVIRWDAALCKIFGVAPQDAPKGYEAYLALVHPEDRARLDARIEHYLATNRYDDLEHRIVRPSGEVRHVLAKAVPIADQAGRAVGFRGGVFDVTDKKLLEGQLADAQKMEAVGQLTAGIAHNFNNLLAIILPNAQLCRAEPGRQNDQRLADIEQAGRRAGEMVRQLMLFAGHAGEAATGPVDVGALAHRVAHICRATFDEKIAVVVEASDGLPPVSGRESQIEQAVLNVCGNARDALLDAATRAPRILVAVDATEAGSVRLRVVDNGPGMTEATRLRVFEPFFTTKAIGHGTGLGLASAYAIVRQHGGKLRCESRPGAGTTFEIELPATVGVAVRGAPPALPERSTAVTVLVVDDEPLLRRVVRAILEQQGYRVLEAADGTEGIYVFERHHATIGAVILDRSMPGLSGEDVLERITAVAPDVPVVLLSGLPSVSWKGPLPALVLSKPVDANVLLEVITKLAPIAGDTTRDR